jgi:hypothetical protein
MATNWRAYSKALAPLKWGWAGALAPLTWGWEGAVRGKKRKMAKTNFVQRW